MSVALPLDNLEARLGGASLVAFSAVPQYQSSRTFFLALFGTEHFKEKARVYLRARKLL